MKMLKCIEKSNILLFIEEEEENNNNKEQNPLAPLKKEDSEDVYLNYLKYSGTDTEHLIKEERV